MDFQCRKKNCDHKATHAIMICIHNDQDYSLGQLPPIPFCEEHSTWMASVGIAALIDLEKAEKELLQQRPGENVDWEKSHFIVKKIDASFFTQMLLDDLRRTVESVKQNSPTFQPISLN